MWLLYLFGVFVIISIGLLFFASKMYDVGQVPHDKNPEALSIPYSEIHFRTKNNKHLHGWWIPRENTPQQKKTLILVHGWKRNVGRMLPYIGPLYKSNFNLLVFDARNHGSSDRDPVASMPKFTEDILAAIDYLRSIKGFEAAQPAVLGLSMGGAAALYAASLDHRISGIITVGAFANPKAVMKLQLKHHHIPYFPFGWMILEYAQYKIGKRFSAFAPENSIGKLTIPVLLIHGKKDVTAPFSQAEKLLQASNKRSTQLWGIEGKGHSDCHLEEGFWDRIIDFLEKA